jgi:Tfp pilus assembly protein FimT
MMFLNNSSRRFSPLTRANSESGVTLSEILITLVLAGVLLALSLSTCYRLMAWMRLSIVTFELSQQWKTTRYQVMGEGATPLSLCMTENEKEQIQIAQIQGDECEKATSWQTLTRGVGIDENNSTLRKVSGVAGNNGTVYRASWADTRGGLGGSWGQLGRITLIASGTPDKRCLFLFRVDGSWDIREDTRCDR